MRAILPTLGGFVCLAVYTFIHRAVEGDWPEDLEMLTIVTVYTAGYVVALFNN